MRATISVDPGVWGYGVGVYVGSKLIAARYAYGQKASGSAVSAFAAAKQVIQMLPDMSGTSEFHIICEVPRIYPAARQKGRPNDLIDLALSAGLFCGALGYILPIQPTIEFIYPRDWKGTVDADEVMIPRILSRISEIESASIVDPGKTLKHNVVDAIGIGLYSLGRLNPKRVIARQ